MPTTAKNHFDQDIARARALLAHARSLPHGTAAHRLLREDLFRSAWMFAVGALDAYFCDAFSHCVACTLIAKEHQASVTFPTRIDELKIPVSQVLKAYAVRDNWRWRMASRQLMERENVLSLATVKSRFNIFAASGNKFLSDHCIDAWVALPSSNERIWGPNHAVYLTLPTGTRAQRKTFESERAKRRRAFEARFEEVIQRRHDCIHNCDRPKVSPQPIGSSRVAWAISDIQWLITQFNLWIDAEFPQFLTSIGCTLTTIAHVQY